MNPNIIKRNELLAQKTIKGLESRNMTGYYAETKEEALRLALQLIPEGATVAMGGAMSAHEIGLVDAVKEGPYNFIDRDAAADKRAAIPLLECRFTLPQRENVLLRADSERGKNARTSNDATDNH